MAGRSSSTRSANISISQQSKLLRVLQTRKSKRVGSSRTKRVDVRIMAATNADLRDEVAGGRFREDLLFRMQHDRDRAPPAPRPDAKDILPLAAISSIQHALRYGRRGLTLDAGAAQALLTHNWPGNVRELDHAVERGVLLAQGATMRAGDLGLRPPGPPARLEDLTLAEAERAIIDRALSRFGGNVSQAAKALDSAGVRSTVAWKAMASEGPITTPPVVPASAVDRAPGAHGADPDAPRVAVDPHRRSIGPPMTGGAAAGTSTACSRWRSYRHCPRSSSPGCFSDARRCPQRHAGQRLLALGACWIGGAIAVRASWSTHCARCPNMIAGLRDGGLHPRLRGARPDDALGLALLETKSLRRRAPHAATRRDGKPRRSCGPSWTEIDVASLRSTRADSCASSTALANDSWRSPANDSSAARPRALQLAAALTGEVPRVEDFALPGGRRTMGASGGRTLAGRPGLTPCSCSPISVAHSARNSSRHGSGSCEC